MSQGCRILVVVDDPTLSLAIDVYLCGRGHRVAATSSAVAALRMVEQETFDVLILDRCLARLSGTEIARIARSKHPTMRLALIGDSAELDQPVDLWLRPPVDAANLAGKLRSLEPAV